MICQYDLYDISFALTLIRSDIENEINEKILSKIILVLDEKMVETIFEENQIRKSVAEVIDLDEERWKWVYCNNLYVNIRLIKDKQIYRLLKKTCSQLHCEINRKNYEKSFDLVDCIHCLPNIIADNNFTVPKKYWKIYVKPYRKKWDSFFLKEEQKRM